MLLHYKKLGSGKPLFIVHGVFGMLDNWLSLGKRWADDYEVYLIDARNHGRSEHSDVMNYQVMAQDIQELMDHLGLDKICLMGHSMGGKVAMKFAILFPDLLEKLIVVDIGPKEYPLGHNEILDALCSLNLKKYKSRTQVDEVLSNTIKIKEIRQFLLKNLYWKDKGVLDFRMNLDVINGNMNKIVESIGYDRVEVPTLFIRGMDSGYIQDDDLMSIQLQFTNSEIADVENAGHWVHAQAPKLMYELVYDFLAE